MIADWPEGVPQDATVNGYGEQPEPDIAEFAVDTGQPKSRPRSNYIPDQVSIVTHMSNTEYEALMVFYKETIKTVKPFRRVDPTSQVTKIFKFNGPPSRSALGGDIFPVSMQFWRLS